MRTRRVCAALFAVTALAGTSVPASARSLTSKLHEFINLVSNPIEGVDVADPMTPLVRRSAARGIDFPVTSTAPGFTYRYDPDLGMFTRSSGSLGPVFAERAETVGQRRFDLGFSYLYADLTDEGGENFGEKVQFASVLAFGDDQVGGVFIGEDFSLASHVFAFSGTYGLTNEWDVNVVVPLVYTVLELEGEAGAGALIDGEFDFGVAPVKFTDFFSNDAFGVGDVLLRTKYRFWDARAARVAGLLTLRFPTGEEDDFQGLGDFSVTPGLVASRAFGRHELHGQLGVECNSDDLERSRVRYALGGVIQPWERLAFLVDVLGSSAFVDDEFTISKRTTVVPAFGLLPNEFVRSQTSEEILAFVPRSDVVDLAVGFKVNITGTAVAFANAIVPLTDDGLRAEVIPAAGIEVSF